MLEHCKTLSSQTISNDFCSSRTSLLVEQGNHASWFRSRTFYCSRNTNLKFWSPAATSSISLAHTVPHSDSVFSVSPEQRAKAVAERFAAELPSRSVPELESIVTSAIKRALAQQLAELESWAERSSEYAMVEARTARAGTKQRCGSTTNGQ